MSFIADLITRVRALVLRPKEERELDEELRFHLSMEEDYRRRHGESHADAHRAAMLALGGVEQVKEDVRDARGTRLFEDSASDFSFALRTLRRSPGFAFVAIATLAVGIGGTTAMFSAVDAVLLQPLPYREPGRLVRLYQTDVNDRNARGFVTPVHLLAYRSRLSSMSSLAGVITYDETGADVGNADGARRIRVLPTTADYFDVVGVHPRLGAAYSTDDETAAHVAVVSQRLWKQELHGDPSAVGGSITMNGTAYRVVGVMPGGFEDPLVANVDAWVPVDVAPGRDASNADNHYFTVIARLRPGVMIAAAQSELETLGQRLAVEFPEARGTRARLDPLKDDIVGPSSLALEIMLGAVALVLLVVCVNIATLMLVRGSERQSEFAVRAALGGERTRLVRQMLVECLVLAIIGDLAGLVVARVAMAGVGALAGETIPRIATMSLNFGVLGVSVLVATVSALIFGVVPAMRVAKTQPSDVLRGSGRASTGGARQLRGREWLVVVQVALAFVLAVGAGLLLSSLAHLQDVPLGVKTAGVLTFELHLPDARYDSIARASFYDSFARDVERLPGVRAAGGVSRLPATGSYHSWGTRPVTGPYAGDQKRHFPSIEQRVIAGDYFRALSIPLIKGRLFDDRDVIGAPDRVVISVLAAKSLFDDVDPIGQRLRAGGREAEVIGVIGDVALTNEGHMLPHIYHAHRQFAGDRNWALTQVVATNDAGGAVSPIRSLLASLDPRLVLFRPMPLEDAIGRGAAQRVFTMRLLITFAAVAIALAGLGLFGVLSYGVRLRTRELGIRMALGARAATIRAMILRQGLVLTAIGLVIGLMGAAVLSRLIASLLFGVRPMDVTVLAGACVLLAVVSGLAAYAPARRATSIDPRESLS